MKLRKSDAARRYLRGPIVQPPNGWDAPPKLSAIIPAAREQLIAAGETEMATEEEALAYINVAAMSAPLDRDWAAIYFFLCEQVWPRWGFVREGDGPVWRVFGFERPTTLHQTQADDLRRLRLKIRRSVEKHSTFREPQAQKKSK